MTDLHATDAHPERCRGALLTLLHLACGLLLGRVVPVLTRAHLQVQDARIAEVMHHILQQQEFCEGSTVKEF